MANAHIPKHSFSSPGCDGRQFANHSSLSGGLSNCVWNWLNVCKYTGLTPFCCLFFCALASENASRANPMEFRGSISATKYEGESQVFTITNWYSVVLDGTNSQIRTGAEGDANVLYSEYGRIGKDSYFMTVLNTARTAQEYIETQGEVVRTIKVDKPFTPINSAMLWVNDGVVADAGLNFITPVWLAYSFGGIFGNGSSQIANMSPIVSVGSRFRELGGEAEVESRFDSRPPKLLAYLVERLTGSTFRKLGLQAPFSGDFTNCIYETIAWTNVQDLTIPLRFRVVENILETASQQSRVIFEGELTMVKPTNSIPVFPPPLITRVVERRRDIVAPYPEYSYTTTDGRLWTRDQILAKGQRSGDRLKLQTEGKGKSYVIVILCFTIFAPLVIIRLMHKKRN